jgi:alcohol dehydrogenase
MGLSSQGLSADGCADKLIEAVDLYMKRLGIPAGLSAIGIKHEVQAMMIEDAMKSPGLISNPKKFDRDKIIELLESVK